MSTNLQKYKLGELIDVRRGASLAGEYYATEGELMRLTLGHFDYQGGGFKDNTSKSDLFFTGPVKQEFILCEGDIITPLTEQTPGLLGSTAMIPESDKYIQSQDVALITPDESKLDRNFCYYLLPSKIVKQQLAAGAQQTKIRHTTPDRIKDLTVYIPSLPEQKAIGKLLKCIDQKIALNREINRNLEAMARQLYDYWFVQFDFPNENGRPYKSSGDKMVWNEKLKQRLPKGWSVKRIKDYTDVLLGGTPDTTNSDFWDGDIPWLNSGEVAEFPILSSERTITELGLSKSATVYAPKGSVTLSITRHLRPSILGINACINQSVVAIKETVEIRNAYLYPYLLNEIPRLMSLRTGAQQPHINKETVEDSAIRVGPSNIMQEYYSIAQPIFDSIIENAKEIHSLISQRDELLPLLMNGQVSVMQPVVNCDLSCD